MPELFSLLKVEDRARVMQLIHAFHFKLTAKYFFTNWFISLQVFI